jgi:hypothetical protein
MLRAVKQKRAPKPPHHVVGLKGIVLVQVPLVTRLLAGPLLAAALVVALVRPMRLTCLIQRLHRLVAVMMIDGRPVMLTKNAGRNQSVAASVAVVVPAS